jgi:hypothetical protein
MLEAEQHHPRPSGMEKPERSIYTVQDFLQWRESGTLDLTPKFQRRGVWTPAARSYFIDTLLRLMPVPPIYIRITQSKDREHAIRQVVDGQQRISCVLDFVDGKFRLSSTLAAPWAGETFEKLDREQRQRIVSYSFSSESFQGISDLEVLEIFGRLNTYSVPLNAQELRNGRYFGLFKQSAYELAHEHLEFWRRHGIFSERNIARMLEVELTSELMIAQIAGMQDKKKSIDQFYKDYDDKFAQRQVNERRFREVIDTINDSLHEYLDESEFSRAPLFYTLYCVIYHREHGLPNVSIKTPKKQLSKAERLLLVEAAQKLSGYIAEGRAREPIPQRYEAFVNACLRQTDNIKPRLERLRAVYQQAFGQ